MLRIVSCLLAWTTLACAIYIIGERDQPYVIGDSTWFQHEVTFVCDNTDNGGVGSSHEFQVWETRPNMEPRVRRVRVTCYAPVIEYTQDKIGYTSLYNIDGSYVNCLTAFKQDDLINTGTDLYEVEGTHNRGLRQLPDGRFLSHERQLKQTRAPAVRAAKNFINHMTYGIGTDILCMAGLSFFGGCGDGGIDEALKVRGCAAKGLRPFPKPLDCLRDWSKFRGDCLLVLPFRQSKNNYTT
jgi:hypothetical protein